MKLVHADHYMQIYVQLDNRMVTITENIDTIELGMLFQNICSKLSIECPNGVVSMRHGNKLFGTGILSFWNRLKYSDIKHNSVIYVIANHFPHVTNNHGDNATGYAYWEWKRNRNQRIETRRTVEMRNESTFRIVAQSVIPRERLFGTNISINYDDLEPVHITLSDSQIRRLQDISYEEACQKYTQKFNESPPEICPITQMRFDNNSRVIMLRCGHFFSKPELLRNLRQHSTRCPLCSRDVRDMISDNESESEDDEKSEDNEISEE